MWKLYRSTILKYPKIPLPEERRLIALAQKGSKKNAEEIVLRHIGFLIFRLHKKAFPDFLKRFGEDLVSEAIFILYQKIKTYDLDYRDKRGNPKPVKFVSYIWKRIDGFILDSLKKKIREERSPKSIVMIRKSEMVSRKRFLGVDLLASTRLMFLAQEFGQALDRALSGQGFAASLSDAASRIFQTPLSTRYRQIENSTSKNGRLGV